MRLNAVLGLGIAALLGIGVPSACGSSTPVFTQSSDASAAIPAPAATSAATTPALRDWPLYGLTAARPNATNAATGIDAGNVGRLHRRRVSVPGTVDSSAVYLHGAMVGGAAHDTAFMTTSYGRTFALDVRDGRILWTFTPPGYGGWSGSAQVTTATPAIDPDRTHLYAAAPDGRIYKLDVADGRPVGGAWPVAVTYDPTKEKIASALNIDGRYLVVTTGGYNGDYPPYVGHVALIDRGSGRLVSVWNSLCANRRGIIRASRCHASDSAIWARAGAVIEPGGRRLLVVTGNGPYNGRTDFGDSVIELTVPALRVRQVYTPRDQAQLNSSDADLGSSSVALLDGRLGAVGGKDGRVRLLRLRALDGRRPGGRRLGGEIQQLSTPNSDQLMTTPAVWRRRGHTTMYMATNSGTGAYALIRGRLHQVWESSIAGTSPVLAGGLLYVYDPSGGGLHVYRPASPRPVAVLPAGSGHWNSPIVVDGVVIEPEGDDNDHDTSGVVDVYSR